MGSGAHGKGEFLYRDAVSIARGANIEAQIFKLKEEEKSTKVPELKVVNRGHASQQQTQVKPSTPTPAVENT